MSKKKINMKKKIFLIIVIALLVITVFMLVKKEVSTTSLVNENYKAILSDKTVVWMGDTLMYGEGETVGHAFPEEYAELTGAELYNTSAPYTTIDNSSGTSLITQAQYIISMKDYTGYVRCNCTKWRII